MGAQKLKPISWREWAGEIERDGGARNPYLSLEERYGFWDIRVSLRSTWMQDTFGDVLLLLDMNLCFGPGISEANIWKKNIGQAEGVCRLGSRSGCADQGVIVGH